MEIHLPLEVIQMALDAHQLINGHPKSTDVRMREIERLEYMIGEAVSALIIKDYIGPRKDQNTR